MKQSLLKLFVTLLLTGASYRVIAQGTVFTYQGRLAANGNLANGGYAMQFDLYAVPTNGTTMGSLTITNVAVTNGLFFVPLDFGAAFDGSPRWLEITIQAPGGQPTTLAPRQQITAVPYAISASTAQSVLGSISTSNLTGQISIAQLPAGVVTNGAAGINVSGTFSGDGSRVTNVSATTLNTFGLLTWPGTFVLSSSIPVGANPHSVISVDVNNDGKADLITANTGANTLSVLTNGGGVFALQTNITVGNGPSSVIAADINNDSRLDLICANSSDNTLTVLTNNGSGQFIALPPLPVGQAPISVWSEDVNADGRMDLICANANDNTLTVLTNNGHSSFVAISPPVAVGSIPFAVVGADFNGDGKMDLATVNTGDNSISVLTNSGFGHFTLMATVNIGQTPESLVSADVNGDGTYDLIAANLGDNALSIVTNVSNGAFVVSSTIHVGAGAQNVTAADLNADGKIDLIVADYTAGSAYILTNNGSGIFALDEIVPTSGQPFAIATGDLNGDGKLDVAAVNAPGSVDILLNVPVVTGSFFNGNGSALMALNASSLATGTIPDARLSSHVAMRNTTNTFTSAASFLSTGSFAGGLTVGSNGTPITNLRFGVLSIVPKNIGSSVQYVTNVFDVPFATTPHMVFASQTALSGNGATFAVTISTITATNIVLNVDDQNIGWSPFLLNYIAWEP
jgi:VCBS repeat protein